MGCDIHFVVEERDPTTNKWAGVFATGSCFNPMYFADGAVPLMAMKHRNYQFFGLLAGVREKGPDPNGHPSDPSLLTQMRVKEWGEDGHSHGHCSLEEFATKWVATQFSDTEYARRKLLNSLPTAKSATGLHEEDDISCYRVCFWFDN